MFTNEIATKKKYFIFLLNLSLFSFVSPAINSLSRSLSSLLASPLTSLYRLLVYSYYSPSSLVQFEVSIKSDLFIQKMYKWIAKILFLLPFFVEFLDLNQQFWKIR